MKRAIQLAVRGNIRKTGKRKGKRKRGGVAIVSNSNLIPLNSPPPWNIWLIGKRKRKKKKRKKEKKGRKNKSLKLSDFLSNGDFSHR